MVQSEIIEYLEKNIGVEFNARQIADAVEKNFEQVCKALNQLLKYGEVEVIEYDRIKVAEILGLEKVTRRMRFFYIKVF